MLLEFISFIVYKNHSRKQVYIESFLWSSFVPFNKFFKTIFSCFSVYQFRYDKSKNESLVI